VIKLQSLLYIYLRLTQNKHAPKTLLFYKLGSINIHLWWIFSQWSAMILVFLARTCSFSLASWIPNPSKSFLRPWMQRIFIKQTVRSHWMLILVSCSVLIVGSMYQLNWRKQIMIREWIFSKKSSYYFY